MRGKLQRDFLRMFMALFAALGIIWIGFYTLAMEILTQSNEQLIIKTEDELLEDLGANIELMEQINYTVSQREEIETFLMEDDLAARHTLAVDMRDMLQREFLWIDNRFSIVAIDNDGWFYRFAGSISAGECERLAILAQDMQVSSHFSATLDDNNHIGYVNKITDPQGRALGNFFVLESERNFLEYYYDSTEDFIVSAAILSGDEVISSNAPHLGPVSPLYTIRQVGITPFQVATWLSPDYDNELNRYFIIGVVLSSVLMMVALLSFVYIQRRKFFTPLIQVMDEADRIGFEGDNRLNLVNNPDFDNLVMKINDLLGRIDRQNELVKNSLLDAQHSKMQTQKATNILLKKQINAHFVINTLSAIEALQKFGDIEKSRTALAALSDMVRYVFEEDDSITVWDELSHLQKYIAIMNIRYDDKITFELDADDNLMDVRIPRMLVQPIIENSILHAFAGRNDNCTVALTANCCAEGVQICVADNGCGMSEETLRMMNAPVDLHNQNSGIEGLDNMAVYNVKRRLFADDAKSSFRVESVLGQGSITTIIIRREGI